MRFVEVDGLGAYLHRTLDDDDLLANMACDAATGVVAEFIDQGVINDTYTVKLDGDGVSDALFLDAHPVYSVETVTYDDAKDITAATRSGAVATFTVDGHGYDVGKLVYVTGVTPTAYNGTWTITAATDDTFTVTLDATPSGSGTAFGTSQEALDPSDYELGDAGIVYLLGDLVPSTWPSGRRNITVQYSSGYEVGEAYEDPTNLPASISLVATQVAARIFEVGMAENESTAGYSVTHVKGTGALTPYEKDILAHYRLEV